MKAFFQVDDGLTNPLFIATVEDNNDPTFNYRVKVRIPTIHNETITTEQLPWAARLCNSFMGVGDEQDLNHAVPEVGTQVLVLAVGSNLNSLVYLGNLYKKTAQTPSDNRYLDTYGIYRKDGQFIGVDKIQKLFMMLFDGDIQIDKVGNITINASKDITVNCVNANLTATSSVNVKSPTSTFDGNIECTGNIKAAAEVSAMGGAVNLSTHTHTGEATECTAPGAPWLGSTDPGKG